MILSLGITLSFGRSKLLYPLAIQEYILGTKLVEKPVKDCVPVKIAHRGYGQASLENSKSAIEAAISAHIRAIEIDLIIHSDGIDLGHDYAQARRNNLPLRFFNQTYANEFETIYYDIKKVDVDTLSAVRQLIEANTPSTARKVFLGLNCELLSKVKRALGVEAGCEMHGALGNWFLGFDTLSLDIRRATDIQPYLAEVLQLQPVLWGFHEGTDITTACHFENPSVMIGQIDSGDDQL